jgi:hypothetical protein
MSIGFAVNGLVSAAVGAAVLSATRGGPLDGARWPYGTALALLAGALTGVASALAGRAATPPEWKALAARRKVLVDDRAADGRWTLAIAWWLAALAFPVGRWGWTSLRAGELVEPCVAVAVAGVSALLVAAGLRSVVVGLRNGPTALVFARRPAAGEELVAEILRGPRAVEADPIRVDLRCVDTWRLTTAGSRVARRRSASRSTRTERIVAWSAHAEVTAPRGAPIPVRFTLPERIPVTAGEGRRTRTWELDAWGGGLLGFWAAFELSVREPHGAEPGGDDDEADGEEPTSAPSPSRRGTSSGRRR